MLFKSFILIAIFVTSDAQGNGAQSSDGMLRRKLRTACSGVCDDGYGLLNPDQIVPFPITSQNITGLACIVIDAALRAQVDGTAECTNGKAQAIEAGCMCEAAPKPQCSNPLNTDRCAELTQFINYDEDCPCLSFCKDMPPMCCPLGESCAVTCPEGANFDTDVVSGCSIDPNKPPVSAPPTTAPPSVPATCVIQQNVENCPSLVANQQPVPSCPPNACYNYCNGQFANCCEPGDFDCTLQCSVAVPDPSQTITITAGCTLPDEPSCTGFAMACTSSTECCSKNCINGICAPGHGSGRQRLRPSLRDRLRDGGIGGVVGRPKRQREANP